MPMESHVLGVRHGSGYMRRVIRSPKSASCFLKHVYGSGKFHGYAFSGDILKLDSFYVSFILVHFCFSKVNFI